MIALSCVSPAVVQRLRPLALALREEVTIVREDYSGRVLLGYFCLCVCVECRMGSNVEHTREPCPDRILDGKDGRAEVEYICWLRIREFSGMLIRVFLLPLVGSHVSFV